MVEPPDAAIARLMARIDAGDSTARGELFSALYDDLHRLAQSHIRRASGPITLSATTLLHEAYLSVAGAGDRTFPDRNRFLGYASRAMRGLVINYVRERLAHKRGGDLTFVALDEQIAADPGGPNLDRLGAALDELATAEPALAELVDLKFFCGFSFAEIAAMRSASERTVQRDWAKARLLLHRALDGEGPDAVADEPAKA